MTIKPIPRYTLDVTLPGYDIEATPVGGGEPISGEDGEWMRAADVEAVLVPGVAYMPVPRCEMCKHWSRPVPASVLLSNGLCSQAFPAGTLAGIDYLETPEDFGCVQFEAKT